MWFSHWGVGTRKKCRTSLDHAIKLFGKFTFIFMAAAPHSTSTTTIRWFAKWMRTDFRQLFRARPDHSISSCGEYAMGDKISMNTGENWQYGVRLNINL